MINKHLYYLCHFCLDFTSNYKNDICKHLNKINKCKSYSLLYNFEEAKKQSLYKKYIFYFDKTKLSKNDILFIISNYHNHRNHIFEDFRNPLMIYKNNSNSFKKEEIKDLTYEFLSDRSESESESESEGESENESERKFICNLCETTFTTKYNLKKHMANVNVCKSKKEYNLFKKQNEEAIKMKLFELQNQMIETNTNSQQNIQNNNIQNIQNNIQNNSTSKNNFKVSLRDFITENYDLTHIDDSYYLKKDFFLYTNFLDTIMLNEKNRNIYFTNDHAVFLNDNMLNKMTDEKAGFLILQKMARSFELFLNKQDDEAKKYYAFINEYYRIIQGQYRIDTLYKDYDIDDKKFVYIGDNHKFRARDRHLMKIKKILEKHDKNIRTNLVKYSDEGEILKFEPNIEDFASKRSRYRDLKS